MVSPPPSVAHAAARIARRLAGTAGDPSAWTPPPLPTLIERIDRALAERRAG